MVGSGSGTCFLRRLWCPGVAEHRAGQPWPPCQHVVYIWGLGGQNVTAVSHSLAQGTLAGPLFRWGLGPGCSASGAFF